MQKLATTGLVPLSFGAPSFLIFDRLGFLERPDGLVIMESSYGLPQSEPTGNVYLFLLLLFLVRRFRLDFLILQEASERNGFEDGGAGRISATPPTVL